MDVTLSNIALRYPGADRAAVEGFDLHVHDGEFLVLVGPSGCGKSTTLRMIAGLELPTSGRIRFGERDVTATPASERDIAMVFQNYALYPHMTVAGNMEFALRNSGVPKDERRRRIAEAADLLDIAPYLDRKPRALSGGQRQRVAMGRAIVRSPEVFLMDEPLSNLDAKLRVQTRTQISALQRRLGVTTVYVTHDQTEAMTMGDRVVVMNEGHIEQVGTPRELYDRPQTLFVAGFIGSPAMNLIPARVEPDGGSGSRLQIGTLTLALPRGLEPRSAAVVVGIRPEDLHPRTASEAPGLVLEVLLTEALGSDTYVYGRRADEPGAAQVVARVGKRRETAVGDRVELTVAPEAVVVFDAVDGRALTPQLVPIV